MSKVLNINVLDERRNSILCNARGKGDSIQCNKNSAAGSVSQRACVYCGARVVLNPITDAYHIVHGPIGCSSYTWDIRGSLTSGAEVYRNSFSTDLREKDIIFGGEKKLSAAIDEIVAQYKPKVIFVYSTCVVGIIGDDLDAVCKTAQQKHNIRVIPVRSTGFAGNKASGYRAACDAIMELIGNEERPAKPQGINFLGDFNLAGELWIIKGYLKSLGIKLHTAITGDSTCDSLKEAVKAQLNIVQCTGSMHYLARKMQEKFDIPFINVSFCGVEDTVKSLLNLANAIGDECIVKKAKEFVVEKASRTEKLLEQYRQRLAGKKVAIYVGGGFKAISLIKQFADLGMKTVIVGTQTGREEEYQTIKELADEGTIILDDSNPFELEAFIKEKQADILVGGVKERPLAYKLCVAFLDHNHERKHPLSGFEGALNFAQETDLSVNSPVWGLVKRKWGETDEKLCQSEC
ncbi:nitrogenase iron-molybdenum cofactor biosynthesis protein NifE [Bacillota bacterium LX-D]|nr:nitrogenase iron-molybdenum cofactor biosynthesis protein NifE [Bacillota bacterium LX-D]